jgi:hypothetical protein
MLVQYHPLKLSQAFRGESSILKVNYNFAFAHLPRSKLLGMRSLPNSYEDRVHNSLILRTSKRQQLKMF